MNLRHLFNIVLVCTLLCACDKEDNINFPITLYAHEVSRTSDIRLFVNKKEIYDTNVIRDFVGDSEYFKLPTNKDVQLSNEGIYFLSKDSVLFGTLTTGFTVRKNATQFLFYSPKMVQVKDGDMVRPLLKYTDELIPVPPMTGYNYITSEVRVGYGSYKNLELSFLSYMRLRKTAYGESFNAGILLNEFNEESINTLQLGDTLAIREYKVRFIAK